MAADTGPIGGNLSHEFIILADTGESKIFTDKRIFDLTSEGTNLEKSSLEQMRKKYEQFYSVTDEKFSKDEFENMTEIQQSNLNQNFLISHTKVLIILSVYRSCKHSLISLEYHRFNLTSDKICKLF